MKIASTISAKTRNTVSRNNASLGIAESILSPAMRDFRAGMHFLHRYAARCHADTESIGRDNLRLLHNTLMGDAHYRMALTEALRSTSQRSLPVSRKLFSAVEIEAEIISLREGGSLRLADQTNQMGLLMMLSGRASLSGNQPGPQSFSRKMHGWLTRSNPQSSQTLKPQDVIWEKPSSPDTQALTASSNDCVVLRVRLPLPALSVTVDVHRRQVGPRIAAVG